MRSASLQSLAMTRVLRVTSPSAMSSTLSESNHGRLATDLVTARSGSTPLVVRLTR